MTDPVSASGALAGTTVIDLTRVLGGPYCTQILADQGAEVIKIEPPTGDETRGWGPPFRDGLSAYFSGANRNKAFLSLDLSKAEGREVLFRLLETADVLIHNFKTGTLEKWGISWEDVLQQRFPRLVYCHITGFGDDGPMGGLPGYDAVIQALSGTMSVNGTPDTGPLRMGTPIVDLGTGMTAAIGILAALLERERSGKGQKLDVPLYDSAVALLHPQAANALMTGRPAQRIGNAHPNISPYDLFPTKTKPVFLAIGNNRQFAMLCRFLGKPELAEDLRFLDNAARVEQRDALRAELAALLADHEAESLTEALLKTGVPAGAVREITEVLDHPHTRHRKMVVELDGYRGTGIPMKMSRTPGKVHSKPGRLGQDSRAVLRARGWSERQIADLEEAGVLIADEASEEAGLEAAG
ncbi:CaiB/BaiF CoA transferase family protein [Algihabitans albus]|uniref:CaiB/BaiF CoA transferase family protein n=1 Tax=Algihabitans albus TaxID=2164067 RepID=UPI000E5D1B4A|nr:CoA transferase [Algihabitans albus]